MVWCMGSGALNWYLAHTPAERGVGEVHLVILGVARVLHDVGDDGVDRLDGHQPVLGAFVGLSQGADGRRHRGHVADARLVQRLLVAAQLLQTRAQLHPHLRRE